MSELLVWTIQTVWIALSELLAPSRSLRVEGWKLYQMKAYDALVAVVPSKQRSEHFQGIVWIALATLIFWIARVPPLHEVDSAL